MKNLMFRPSNLEIITFLHRQKLSSVSLPQEVHVTWVDVNTDGAYSSSMLRLDVLSIHPALPGLKAADEFCGFATWATKANLQKKWEQVKSHTNLHYWQGKRSQICVLVVAQKISSIFNSKKATINSKQSKNLNA